MARISGAAAKEWRVNGYIVAVAMLALALLRATWQLPDFRELPTIFVFIALTIVARAWKISLQQRGHSGHISIYPAIVAAGAIHLGPTTGALLGAVAGLVHWPWKSSPRTYLFDAAQLALTAIVIGSLPRIASVWDLLPGELSILSNGVLIGAFAYLLNWGLLVTVMTIDEGGSPLRIWRERGAWLVPHFLVYGLLAIGMAWATRYLGLVGTLIFTLPLFMMRLVTNQFIEHTRDSVTQLRKAHEELAKKHEALEHSYDATRTAIAGMLRARDDETEGHSERVIALALALGKAFELTPTELDALEIGAQLHDIGKVGVADAVLHKPGPLTPEEWVEMRRHPVIGDELVSAVPFLVAALPVVRHHHERWDGSGYPDGLKGTEIPLSARLFAIVDVYDALVSDRPYRRALSHDEAVAEIAKGTGSHFDPACVAVFLRLSDDWRPSGIKQSVLGFDDLSAVALRRRSADWAQHRTRLNEERLPASAATKAG